MGSTWGALICLSRKILFDTFLRQTVEKSHIRAICRSDFGRPICSICITFTFLEGCELVFSLFWEPSGRLMNCFFLFLFIFIFLFLFSFSFSLFYFPFKFSCFYFFKFILKRRFWKCSHFQKKSSQNSENVRVFQKLFTL